MKTRMQTHVWLYSIAAVLGCCAAAIVVWIVILTALSKPVHETLFVLGLVAGAGFVRLLFPYLLI